MCETHDEAIDDPNRGREPGGDDLERLVGNQLVEQEAFEKYWAHSPLRAAERGCSNFALPFTRCRYYRHHYQDEPKPAIAIAQAACDSSITW